jgi:NAD-dependent deacetylase
LKDPIAAISEKLAQSSRNVVFTGAGISTESNIPDYRSKGGIWDKFQPVYFDEFMRSKEARIEYWRRKSELYRDMIQAEPNPAHLAVAELDKLGLLQTVITQNIDGLHQKAGLTDEKVIELHGNNVRVRCMACGILSSIHDAKKRIEAGDPAPECNCGGYLKPDTISFGQQLNPAIIQAAEANCRECNLLLVVGSTLLVHPAASLPVIAKQSGAFLALVNLSETPCDSICDVLIREKAGSVLPEIVTATKNIFKNKGA